MSTEAVITPLAPDADDQVCGIEGCGRDAVYQVVKLADDGSEEEKFFCSDHGLKFSNRAHLVISENA